MDTGECQPLYHSIRDFYEGMNMKIAQEIPMLLVERQALNEAMEGEKDVSSDVIINHAQIACIYGQVCVYFLHISEFPRWLILVVRVLQGHHMPETRGLCLSEEQTVNTVRSHITFFNLLWNLKSKLVTCATIMEYHSSLYQFPKAASDFSKFHSFLG
jgi:hypothetical protein